MLAKQISSALNNSGPSCLQRRGQRGQIGRRARIGGVGGGEEYAIVEEGGRGLRGREAIYNPLKNN